MNKHLLILYFLFLLILDVNAQSVNPWRYDPSAKDVNLWKLRRYELSLGGGFTQIFGDIGGFSPGKNIIGLKDITYRQTRANLNPSVKFKISDKLTARGNFAFGYFHAIDERGSNIKRGFESSTLFFEPSLIGEYHLLLSTINGRGNRKKRIVTERSIFSKIDLYFFTGVGMVAYTILPNEKLTPYINDKTGGAAIIPAGLGANLIYSRYFNFGLEFGGRYAFTDNLDGYSSRYSKFNDAYYLLNFTITYKIRTGANGLPFFK
ncbi:MAG: hypothetical protein IPH69_05290 [Bacteroidales bacterium]|nr:hypothetical protein [Bacteroidales bacterium]